MEIQDSEFVRLALNYFFFRKSARRGHYLISLLKYRCLWFILVMGD